MDFGLNCTSIFKYICEAEVTFALLYSATFCSFCRNARSVTFILPARRQPTRLVSALAPSLTDSQSLDDNIAGSSRGDSRTQKNKRMF